MSRLFSLWRRTAGGGWRTGDRLCPQLTPPPLPGPERPARTEAMTSDISSTDGSGGFDQRVILVVPKTPRTSNTSGPAPGVRQPLHREEVLLGRDVHDVDATSGACGWPGRPGLARGGIYHPRQPGLGRRRGRWRGNSE